MSRIIREHRVFGRSVRVKASTEDEARDKVRAITSDHIWEMSVHISIPNYWEAYVAKHEDCFALND